MTDFRPEPTRPDPDDLADRLDALLASGQRHVPADDPRLEAARLLANAPRPVMRAEASARIEAQLVAAARNMPVVQRQRMPAPRRISWPLAAAAALVLVLAVALVPQVVDQAAAPTPTASPTVTVSPTATASPSATPTFTPSPTLSPIVTATPDPLDVPALIVTRTALPSPVGPQGQPAGEQGEQYDCSNPPPEGAPAVGWRERCQGGLPPNEVVPGQQDRDTSPGNSGNAPGQIKK